MAEMQSRTAIVVEDARDMAEFLADLCAVNGFRAILAGGAEEFEQHYYEDADLVLLDLRLPGKDGVEVLRMLGRARCTVPIVLVSGLGLRVLRAAADAGRAYGLRIHGLLEKPFALDEAEGLLETAPPRRSDTTTELEVEALRDALDHDRIEPHFQPRIELAGNELVGFEALARIRTSDGRSIPPSGFVEVAVRAGLIGELTDRMLVHAIEAWRNWRRLGLHCSLSVNIPLVCLENVQFPDRVGELLQTWEVDRDQLVLDLPERGWNGSGRVLDSLTRLAMKNVGIAIDDFGTGEASLPLLERLPCTEVKIHRSLTGRLTHSDSARRQVERVLQAANALGLATTAVGIEDQGTLEILAALGCEYGQGFFLSPPEPRSVVDRLYAYGVAG